MVVPDRAASLASGTNVALGIIMFGMGLTLTVPDFALVARRPVPVVIGVVVQYVIMPSVAWVLTKVLPALPWVSVLGICYVVLAVVGKSADTIKAAGLLVVLVVACHNVFGYLLGWCAGHLAAKDDPRVARTTSIEVGMQNSGLAAGLAIQYFTPEAALPGAVFSIWHNLSGAVLATIYRRSDARLRARGAARPSAAA